MSDIDIAVKVYKNTCVNLFQIINHLSVLYVDFYSICINTFLLLFYEQLLNSTKQP